MLSRTGLLKLARRVNWEKAEMSGPTSGPSGGINNTFGTISVSDGDVVAGPKTTTTTYYAPAELHNAWQPVADAIRTAPLEKQVEAAAKLDDLKKEVAKGDKAEDTTIAKLLKGLVALVPAAVSSVVSIFATPILGGVAGPVTKFVLSELGEGGK